MNLETLKTFFAETTNKVITLLLGVLIFFLYLIFFDNPQGEKAFGNLPSLEVKSLVSSQLNYQIETSFGAPAKLAKVYQYDTPVSGQQIAQKLKFSQPPASSRESLFWQEALRTLLVKTAESSFVYNDLNPIGFRKVNENQAFEKAKQTLVDFGLAEGKTLSKLETRYLVLNLNHIEEVTGDKLFNAFSFSIAAKVGNLEVVNHTGTKESYSVVVGIDGAVKKIQGSLKPLKFIDESTYPLKNKGEVKKALESKNFSFVYIGETSSLPKGLTFSFSKLETVLLIENNQSKVLRPVILLTGQARVSNFPQVRAVVEALEEDEIKR